MPSVTKVGANRIGVEFVASLIDEKGTEMWGSLVPQQDRILVSMAITLPRQKEAFLHEVIHAVGYSMGDDVKEAIVNRLSLGLYQWMVDNPTNVRWLIS